MKNRFTLCSCLIVFLFLPSLLFSQNEPFTKTVLNEKSGAGNYRLAHPFDIVYGPDNFLYITEKVGRVVRVDTGTGVRQILLDHRSQVQLNIARPGYLGGAAESIGQNGMLGLALHPNFNNGTDSIFVAYSNTLTTIRISRFKYNSGPTPTLSGETILLSGIPAGNDHSTGRMIIGPDNKLYYSCGDLGNNQFNNKCQPIRSQLLPLSTDIDASNWSNYSGKILRINLDGSIPADNPLWNGVRSHIYTIGHRNPQGLVWEKNPSNGVSIPTLKSDGKLFSAEHGPNTGDELNIIEGGKNYGWPYISGVVDNLNYQYTNWSSASGSNCANTGYQENPFLVPGGATVIQESAAPADVMSNFKPPLLAAYTQCTPRAVSQCDLVGDWIKYPTIAPSSIEFYSLNSGKGIPGWYPSLLVATLRTGTVYRYKLNSDKTAIIGDSIPYFKAINRYRDIAMSPDGKIFLITDSIGSTSGPSGTNEINMVNRGGILSFAYTGSVLSLKEPTARERISVDYSVNVYPNPTSSVINVEFTRSIHKPINYRLYDITGKLVVNYMTSNDNFSINVEKFRRGIYILKLYNGHGAEVRMEKIILQ